MKKNTCSLGQEWRRRNIQIRNLLLFLSNGTILFAVLLGGIEGTGRLVLVVALWVIINILWGEIMGLLMGYGWLR